MRGRGSAIGIFIDRPTLAQQRPPRLTGFGEGLILFQPPEQAADIDIGAAVQAELVIFIDRQLRRPGIGEAEHSTMGKAHIVGKCLSRLNREIVGAEEFPVIEE